MRILYNEQPTDLHSVAFLEATRTACAITEFSGQIYFITDLPTHLRSKCKIVDPEKPCGYYNTHTKCIYIVRSGTGNLLRNYVDLLLHEMAHSFGVQEQDVDAYIEKEWRSHESLRENS